MFYKAFFSIFASHKRLLGIFEALLSGICFGILGICGKLAFQAGLSPGEFLATRFGISAFVLGGGLLSRPRRLRVSRRVLLDCFLLGVFGCGLEALLFFHALQGLSVSLTVLLLYIFPILVAFGAWMIWGERPRLVHWLSLPMVLGGLVLLIGAEAQVYRAGFLVYGFASAVAYAAYILYSSHRLRGVSPLVSVFYIQASAALVLSACFLRGHTFSVLPSVLGVILSTSVVGSLLAMVLLLSAMKKLKSFEVSILSTSEPLTGIGVAWFVLGERLNAAQAFGVLLVLGAIVAIARYGERRAVSEGSEKSAR